MPGSLAVIDASTSLKLVLSNVLQEQCRALIDRLLGEGFELVAPVLWAYETTSGLCRIVHMGQLTAAEGQRALAQMAALDVRLIPPDNLHNRRAFDWTVRLGRVAAYDSYYLALAEALGCDLWTADRRLFNAVNLPWVQLVPSS